jgi:hypothetical protein
MNDATGDQRCRLSTLREPRLIRDGTGCPRKIGSAGAPAARITVIR